MFTTKIATRLALALALSSLPFALGAQEPEGFLPTQTLVRADAKSPIPLAAADIKLEINGKPAALTSLTPLQPSGAQVALLIDDGLSRSAGIQLNDLRAFANNLAPGTELLVGYMTNGSVIVTSPFTTDHAAAAASIRLPMGMPGQSASPYFCLSEFVRHWPGYGQAADLEQAAAIPRKARFVMMITNGVDPYNGSTSILNQDSPYVASAVLDAQRAGVAVSSVYYSDAGFRGRGSFSGQSYLAQVADGTGGTAYYQGSINPVSLTPYLTQFQHAIAETYVANFNANTAGEGRERLVRLKMSSSVPKLKLRHADQVRPGNLEAPTL